MPKRKTDNYPPNWSSTIPYLSTPIIAPSLAKNILSTQAVLTSPSLEPNTPTIPSPTTPYTNIRITPINNPTHPAYQQHGLFTTRAHTPGEIICLYLGYVHSTTPDINANSHDSQSDKSNYDLSLDRDLDLAIDAATMGNEARFINDYRGITSRPNAEFRDVFVIRNGVKERGVGVFVKAAKEVKGKKGSGNGNGKGKGEGKVGKKAEMSGIAKGEEVLVSYGRGFWCFRREEMEGGVGEDGTEGEGREGDIAG